MGRPDMGRDKDRIGGRLKGDPEEVFAVKTKDRSAVGMEVADGFQTAGEALGIGERGQQDQVVDLTDFAVLFIDGADFGGEDKAGTSFPASSLRQAGWVKSPVPIRSSPFRPAHRSRSSGMQSLLVALEYFE